MFFFHNCVFRLSDTSLTSDLYHNVFFFSAACFCLADISLTSDTDDHSCTNGDVVSSGTPVTFTPVPPFIDSSVLPGGAAGVFSGPTGMTHLNVGDTQCLSRHLSINPLSPHDALKHHFTSLKTDLIFLQQRVLERKFPWNWFTNTWWFSSIFKKHQIIFIHYYTLCTSLRISRTPN